MASLDVAAIVVTHRGGELLRSCLDSLALQSHPLREIRVVVSNEEAVEVPAHVPSLRLGRNVGYAEAANLGIEATRGEILLLNDDTVLEPRCVEALVAAWTGDGVYQPRIRLADGSGRLDNLGHGLFPDGAVWALGRNGPDRPPNGPPAGFSGAAVMLARSTWNTLGGFDARFGSFSEDVDFSLRCLRRGIRVRAVPDAIVAHHLGATWGRANPEKIRLIERNRIRAAVRSLPLTALLTMPAWTAARYALFGALAATGRGPGEGVGWAGRVAALVGMAQGMRDVPAAWRDRRRDAADWSVGEAAMWAAMWRGRARWEDLVR